MVHVRRNEVGHGRRAFFLSSIFTHDSDGLLITEFLCRTPLGASFLIIVAPHCPLRLLVEFSLIIVHIILVIIINKAVLRNWCTGCFLIYGACTQMHIRWQKSELEDMSSLNKFITISPKQLIIFHSCLFVVAKPPNWLASFDISNGKLATILVSCREISDLRDNLSYV